MDDEGKKAGRGMGDGSLERAGFKFDLD